LRRPNLDARPDPTARATPAALAPTTPTAPTAIIAALPAELRGVLKAATAARRERPERPPYPHRPRGGRRGQWRWVPGTLAGEAVVMAATGDGEAAAAAGVEAMLSAVRPRRLLVLGVAGGLTPGLASGTLVAARQVVAEDGAAAPGAPDAAWLAQAVAGGAVAGVAVAARAIAADPAAKRRLLRGALGSPGPLGHSGEPAAAWPAATVDLESLAYARAAAAHGVPYLVVRAVLDPAEETLPLDFEACRTAGGRVSNTRVVLRALARPSTFRALWRLRGRVAAEAARLAALAQRLMAAPDAGAGAAAAGAAAGNAADGGGGAGARAAAMAAMGVALR
jgi:adenosylhomocysteine nucleosidase